jgi:hypothetical protein
LFDVFWQVGGSAHIGKTVTDGYVKFRTNICREFDPRMSRHLPQRGLPRHFVAKNQQAVLLLVSQQLLSGDFVFPAERLLRYVIFFEKL